MPVERKFRSCLILNLYFFRTGSTLDPSRDFPREPERVRVLRPQVDRDQRREGPPSLGLHRGQLPAGPEEEISQPFGLRAEKGRR